MERIRPEIGGIRNIIYDPVKRQGVIQRHDDCWKIIGLVDNLERLNRRDLYDRYKTRTSTLAQSLFDVTGEWSHESDMAFIRIDAERTLMELFPDMPAEGVLKSVDVSVLAEVGLMVGGNWRQVNSAMISAYIQGVTYQNLSRYSDEQIKRGLEEVAKFFE